MSIERLIPHLNAAHQTVQRAVAEVAGGLDPYYAWQRLDAAGRDLLGYSMLVALGEQAQPASPPEPTPAP